MPGEDLKGAESEPSGGEAEDDRGLLFLHVAVVKHVADDGVIGHLKNHMIRLKPSLAVSAVTRPTKTVLATTL